MRDSKKNLNFFLARHYTILYYNCFELDVAFDVAFKLIFSVFPEVSCFFHPTHIDFSYDYYMVNNHQSKGDNLPMFLLFEKFQNLNSFHYVPKSLT